MRLQAVSRGRQGLSLSPRSTLDLANVPLLQTIPQVVSIVERLLEIVR
jgi:hypothetical protein